MEYPNLGMKRKGFQVKKELRRAFFHSGVQDIDTDTEINFHQRKFCERKHMATEGPTLYQGNYRIHKALAMKFSME